MADPSTTPRDIEVKFPRFFDPLSQAHLWVPNELYRWQKDVIVDIFEPGSHVALRTPNQSGKTSVIIPVAGLSFMAAFPGGKVISTSGVMRQISEQLWPNLKAALRPYEPSWSVIDSGMEIRAPRVEGKEAATWTAFTTIDPERAEGFHPQWDTCNGERYYKPLLAIIDEAKTFKDERMFNAFQTCEPDFWLVVSTPGADEGPFWKCFNEWRGKPWKCHEVTNVDCPHLQTPRALKIRQIKIDQLGIDDPFVQSWIFGNFFRKGARFVFPHMDHVERAMNGQIEAFKGPRFAALDFSGGGDEQVFMMREGNELKAIEVFHYSDTDRLASTFIGLLRKYEVRAENVIGDNGGLGQAVMDNMGGRGFQGMRRYMNNRAARNKNMYKSRDAEDHFALRYMLERGEVVLLPDDKLKEQIRRRKYEMPNDDSNRIILEPKDDIRKRGDGSPDRLDTLVMLYSEMPTGTYLKKDAMRQDSRCPHFMDAMKRHDDDSTFGNMRLEE